MQYACMCVYFYTHTDTHTNTYEYIRTSCGAVTPIYIYKMNVCPPPTSHKEALLCLLCLAENISEKQQACSPSVLQQILESEKHNGQHGVSITTAHPFSLFHKCVMHARELSSLAGLTFPSAYILFLFLCCSPQVLTRE